MKLINTANIACGFHAGSKTVIEKTIKIAKEKNVSIGAHPGFEDKKNFGRKRIELEKNALFIHLTLVPFLSRCITQCSTVIFRTRLGFWEFAGSVAAVSCVCFIFSNAWSYLMVCFLGLGVDTCKKSRSPTSHPRCRGPTGGVIWKRLRPPWPARRLLEPCKTREESIGLP